MTKTHKNTLGVKVSSSINSSILWTHESSDLYPDSGYVQISSWNPFILRCKTSILPHCLPFQVCQLNARPHIRQKPGWTVALAGWWSAWKMRTDIYSCTILLDSTGESVNGRVGRVPSDFIWFPPPKGSTEMGSFAPAPAFSESQKAQLVCTK